MSVFRDQYFIDFEERFRSRCGERPVYVSTVRRILNNLSSQSGGYGYSTHAVRRTLSGGVTGGELGLTPRIGNPYPRRLRMHDVCAYPESVVWDYLQKLDLAGQIRPSLSSMGVASIDDVFKLGLHREMSSPRRF